MKNSDKAGIVLIASLSILVAYFVAGAVIGNPSNESTKVKTVEPISSEVVKPDSSIFNPDAINPTVEVVIGDQ